MYGKNNGKTIARKSVLFMLLALVALFSRQFILEIVGLF